MLAEVMPMFGSSQGCCIMAGGPAPASASLLELVDDEQSVASSTDGVNGSATCICCCFSVSLFDVGGSNPASYSRFSSNASNLRKPFTSSALLNATADRALAATSEFPSSPSSNRYFGNGSDSARVNMDRAGSRRAPSVLEAVTSSPASMARATGCTGAAHLTPPTPLPPPVLSFPPLSPLTSASTAGGQKGNGSLLSTIK
mmetsp:Transcript_28371/g.53562  ORF Transcript_28371/g.53562 Transcript_28371/m.53562 type:complete len:201 (-) Transcript_28371:1627-2229(-)